jgi:hypothetical protein
VAAWYVYQSFVFPDPGLRILLRTIPVLPLAAWTIFFDRERPLRKVSGLAGVAGRVLLLAAMMAFAAAVLGLGLNWVYDPNRVR